MQWNLRSLRLTLFSFYTALLLGSQPTAAQQVSSVESVTVMSESALAVPMAEITSDFVRSHSISVSANFGDSAVQSKKIEDGESADLFITSQADLIEQMKTKGLVDVYSISPMASQGQTSYLVVVVAGENMTPARVFLEHLKSEGAKKILKKHGLSTP